MNQTREQDTRDRPVCPVKPWVRSRPVRTMFRPEEIDDLIEISRVWGIPVATVVWTIAVDQIARWRRQAPNLGQHGLAIAGGLAVTRYATERARKHSE